MLSFWEKQTIKKYDFIMVGAGIMGCSVAFELRLKFPKAGIVVLERGVFPSGASTKNAGFACFGSPTEILSDIQLLGTQKAAVIIAQRYEGLKILQDRLSDEQCGRTNFGGYELLMDTTLSESVLNGLNEWLFPVFKSNIFTDVSSSIKSFGFKKVTQMINCRQEAQIDSGRTMQNYWKLLQEHNIPIITGALVKHIQANRLTVSNTANSEFQLSAEKIFVCTNAFINELLPEMPVKPGRGQVLISKEIKNLPFKGSFHFQEGFYYFRNVGNRVLFGGGRNLDFKTEETTAFEINEQIKHDLLKKLNEIILPETAVEIEQYWQGIMAFSDDKKPIIMPLNNSVTYVMACNGMGVALSPFVAKVAVAGL